MTHSPARRALVAGTLGSLVLSAGLLAGCGLVPSNRAGSGSPSDGGAATSPAAPPTTSTSGPATASPATPSPSAGARSVSATNLLTVDDIYVDDPMSTEVVEAPDGAGRPVSQSYLCLPADGLAGLGATSMVTRDFAYKIINPENDPYPKSPLKNKPVVYTQALQFADEAAATAARTTYAGWIRNCPTTLLNQGYGIDKGQSLKLATLPAEGGTAQAGMVAYVQPGAKDTDNLYWESAGVTQVKDRLMITIVLSWGEDTQGTFDESEGDATFINPQVYLTETSVERLARP